MMSWRHTSEVSRWPPQVPVWGSVNLSHVFTHHLSGIWLLLTREDRWIFDNRGVIFPLIHWCEPHRGVIFPLIHWCEPHRGVISSTGANLTVE